MSNLKRMLVDRVLGRGVRPQPIRAVDSITARFESGMRVGLFGPNGSGKSSLLRLAGGIYQPTGGTITHSGRRTPLLGLGLGANIELSARDNIELLLRFEGVDPSPGLIRDIWTFTELDERFLGLSLRHFSTGMMMRLFFAVSMSTEPEILLMDEWLSVVDETFLPKAEKRLRDHVSRANILIIASHNLQLLRDVCDHTLFLRNGRIERVEVNSPSISSPARSSSIGEPPLDGTA